MPLTGATWTIFTPAWPPARQAGISGIVVSDPAGARYRVAVVQRRLAALAEQGFEGGDKVAQGRARRGAARSSCSTSPHRPTVVAGWRACPAHHLLEQIRIR